MLKKVTPEPKEGKFVIYFNPIQELPGGYWGWAGTVNEPIYGRFDKVDDEMVRILSWEYALEKYLEFTGLGYPCDIFQIE